jgi:SAM-dependent methyltransferase
MLSPANCPLCGASSDKQSVATTHVYGDDGKRAVFHCSHCDVRYLFPGLTPEEEHRFYAAEFESFMHMRSSSGAGWDGPEKHIVANEAQRLRRMSHLRPLLNSNSNILEVGSSSGFMLYPLIAEGHTCTAIEPSGTFSDYVRARGIKCYDSISAMSQDNPDVRFDIILHYYVLEHVSDAVSFLQDQLALLKPGGRIVFEVPHANDALTALYKIPAYEKFIWVVSHRWYFSTSSLMRSIALAGGKGQIVLDQRYDLSNHLVWAKDGKPGGLGRYTAVLGQAIENQYKRALVDAGYADTLVGIVEKL